MEAQRRTLTGRQQQVVEWIAAGCSNEEVGGGASSGPRCSSHCRPLRLMTCALCTGRSTPRRGASFQRSFGGLSATVRADPLGRCAGFVN
jgi:hypothetical protein